MKKVTIGAHLLILQVSIYLSLSYPIPDSGSSKIEESNQLNSKLESSEDGERYSTDSKQLERNEESSDQQLDMKKQDNTEIGSNKNFVREKRQDIMEKDSQDEEQFYNSEHLEHNSKKTIFPDVIIGKDENSDHAIADDLRGSNSQIASDVKRQRRKSRKYQEKAGDLCAGTKEGLKREGQMIESKITEGPSLDLNVMRQIEDTDLKGGDLTRRERNILNLEDVAEIHEMSPETIETLKKINPLTIGEQVSQRLRNHNSNSKNKVRDKSSDINYPHMLQDEDKVVDPSSCSQENDEVLKQQMTYEKQQPPNIVQKSCSNTNNGQHPPKIIQKPCPNTDYGFSVIILAGDPIKIGGHGHGTAGAPCHTGVKNTNGQGKMKKLYSSNEEEYKTLIESGGSDLEFPIEEIFKKEVRVPKSFSRKVDFPIYDEDLPFVPDPFHGLLDGDYWNKPNPNNAINNVNPQHELNFSPHGIRNRQTNNAYPLSSGDPVPSREFPPSGYPPSNSTDPASNGRDPPSKNKDPPSNGKNPPSNSGEPPSNNRDPSSNIRYPPSNSRDPPNNGYPPSNSGEPISNIRYPPLYSRKPPSHSRDPPSNGGDPPSNDGEPPSNDGDPPSNGGDPPSNGGDPPSNGGDPPSNGGDPPSNGGDPPSDSGYPPSNKGNPHSNRGYPPSNRGYPPSNSRYPSSNNGYPSSKSGHLPNDQGTPPELERLEQFEANSTCFSYGNPGNSSNVPCPRPYLH